MSLGTRIAWNDTVLPFQLEDADVRGRVARLGGVLDDVMAQHSYPPPIEALLAEMVMLTALIGQMVKLRWKLSLQVRGNGPARLIATDYYAPTEQGEPGRLRGFASFDAERLDEKAAPFSQIGQGFFAVLIDQGPGSEPYQGITPIAGNSLVDCAESYFLQSEQIPTRFALAQWRREQGRGPWQAGALMLQHVPPGPARDRGAARPMTAEAADDWNRVTMHVSTLTPEELAGDSVQPTELLVRLFHSDRPRVFDPQAVKFGCTCSADRVRESLSIYSAKDIAQMTTEAGIVTADCQFCGAHYELDPATLGFEAGTDGR